MFKVSGLAVYPSTDKLFPAKAIDTEVIKHPAWQSVSGPVPKMISFQELSHYL